MRQERHADQRGVSPVIAVLLMVALVVVLAAVMAPPLMTMASSPTKGAQAGATAEFDRQDGTVTVEFVDNIDAEDLEVNVTVETNPAANSVSVARGSRVLDEPGESVVFEEDPGNADEDVEVSVLVTGVRNEQRVVVLRESGTI